MLFRLGKGGGGGYQNATKEYISFIRGGKTTHGVTFEEIMNYTDRQLEYDHAFIQWIFPLAVPSRFNPEAPVINISEIQRHPEAKEAMLRSYEKMTRFWGLFGDSVDRTRITLLDGHNGLRFSRFLQSLVYHGHVALAQEALDKVKANLSILSPTMGKSGKTLWEEVFLEANEAMSKLAADHTK